MPDPELSVIVPVLNESANVGPLLRRLVPVLESCVASFEILFVDDGSTDDTLAVLRAAHTSEPRICAVALSRNFGKEVAIAAGLDHARGAAAVLIDADLQHPPEIIETFVARWREGYKNVYGQRVDRAADHPVRRILTRRFYRLFASVGDTDLPEGAGDFRLLDAKAVAALRCMREHARFSKGLYAWIGFKSIGVPFEVAPRAHGETRFSFRKLTLFALDGLMSFSTLPLRVGIDVPGYASLIVSITFFAGIQLVSLGVIGAYVGRIFAEVKRRPLYLVEEHIGAPSLPEDSAGLGPRDEFM
jgi:glycosyltransferase involved in cell wall biosynthesis